MKNLSPSSFASAIFLISFPSALIAQQQSSSVTEIISPEQEQEAEEKPEGFRPVDSFRGFLNQETIFAIFDDGERIEQDTRSTIQDADGFYYTIDQLNNWVKYELDEDRGVFIHALRNGEYNSTIVFPKPWLMIPSDIEDIGTYESKVPFTVYHATKDTRDGEIEWSIKYVGITSRETDSQTFDKTHHLTSRVEIDFPYKFGLTFDQEHYFDDEFGEVYRRIDGDATFLGFSIKSREFIESFSETNDLDESSFPEIEKRIEDNVEKITLDVRLAESSG